MQKYEGIVGKIMWTLNQKSVSEPANITVHLMLVFWVRGKREESDSADSVPYIWKNKSARNNNAYILDLGSKLLLFKEE